MQNNWVDFRTVKSEVSMQAVLDHYGITGKLKRQPGDELRGDCPLPGHKTGTAKGSFRVSLTKNAFNCFGCGGRGNILDFVAKMEGCNVPEAARKIAEWFKVTAGSGESSGAATDGNTGSKLAPGKKEKSVEDRGKAEAVNKPLSFQLKSVDLGHPYVSDRGISKETAETFGVGFFSGRGSMAGRVVIPIHNERGELVAYAGRAIDSSEPKYKLPAGFHKSAVLFNLHRVTAPEVILVEGFFDCMKVWQSLHPFVVALMGSSMSEQQEQLLLRQFRKVTLLLDGDEAGRKAAEEIANRLVHSMHVRIVDLPDGKQPDQLQAEELDQILSKL